MEDSLPKEPTMLRKSAFGRTNLFLKTSNVIFRDIRCLASSTARQASASIFHAHQGNQSAERPEKCACWHCCHSFEGAGMRLPRIFDPSEKVYHVYGWFCSANCAKAYILEHSTFDRGYQMNIFVRMLRDVYGISDSVNEAPPRISLSMFGGPFDIEAFRTQKNVCVPVTPPFVSYCMLIEERSPNASIGEHTDSKPRGSVRGLRRPERPPQYSAESNDICGPKREGLYSEFIKSNTVDVQPENDSQPPPKRTRTIAPSKTAKPQHNTGLAKFACTK